MKKRLLFLVALFIPIMAFAYDLAIDCVRYELDNQNKTAKVVDFEYSWNCAHSGIVIYEKVIYNGVEYSVTSIGDDAFSGCSSIISITIPNSVISIGCNAFYDCSSLTSVNISDLTAWCNISFCSNIFGNGSSNPLQYAKKLYLNGELVTNLVIPDDIDSIKSYAFHGCSSFTSITIPQSVTSIGSHAFYGCTGLMSIDVDKNNQNYASIDGVLYDKNITNLICCPEGKTSIEIPKSVVSIGCYAFNGYSSLTSVNISDLAAWCNISFCRDLFGNVSSNPLHYAKKLYLNGELVTNLVIPDGIDSIKSYAFHGCSSFTSITIPQSVTSIGSHAFYDCNGIISITWNAIKCNSTDPFNDIRTQITSFTFGNSVDYIPDHLCSDMQKLTSIEIPNSVTSIGNNAFRGCIGLTSIEIPNNVVNIGGGIFSNCDSLQSVILSENITSLPCGIEENPNSWNSFYYYGFFENCKSLKTIVIPKSVTSIGDYAFEDCLSLTSIIISNSVISIGDNAFSGCDNLRTVEIGNSIETLGNSAFEECTGIYSIKINAIVPPFIKDDTFMDVSRTAQIKVPCGAMAAYQGSTYWNEFTNYIESPYSLSVEVNDNTMGMAVVTKQNTCTDITATVQAQARPGYEFVKWSDGFTENPHTVFVMEDMAITAEFELDGTPVDNIDESSVMIYVQNGVIYVEGVETDYHVLDAAGRLIYSGCDAQLSLPRGVYVIVVGGEVEKVVL